MRIIQMHPNKKRTVRVLLQPRQRVRHDHIPAALGRVVTISSRRHLREARIVGVKASFKAGTLRAFGSRTSAPTNAAV